MSSTAQVIIHSSQFPETVRRALHESLRTRRVNPKFHYDSVKQTQQWLALHQAWSASRNDVDCAAAYNRGFDAAASQIRAPRVQLIGLGCGGGQKDTRLLKRLQADGRELFYTPCDVSPAMVLTARQTARAVVSEAACFPLVCDLATTEDLPEIVRLPQPIVRRALSRRPALSRLITFFGMIPNFEPHIILPRLAALVGPEDVLLFSANLAPGRDYAAGVKRILPQYNNPATRAWLMTFLLDLGVPRTAGQLRFGIETGRAEATAGPDFRTGPTASKPRPGASFRTGGAMALKRVVADFQFRRPVRITVGGEAFGFRRGETIRLFFSYRYTPTHMQRLLVRHGLAVRQQWIAPSGEEGVFLCRRQGDRRGH